MAEESTQSQSPLRWVVMALVFIAALFVLKLVFGFALVIFKWAAIIGIALFAAAYVTRKVVDKR